MSAIDTKSFKIVTLGCRTNQYEAQAYRDQLLSLGYFEAGKDDKADICIVNTCTVTESADKSSRHAIRQLIRENEGSQVLVTGCFADRQPQVVGSIPGVSHVVPNAEKENLLAKIFPPESLPEFSVKNFEAHTRAFVKIQDGCNSFCTYCIIPYVRGRSRSKTKAQVVAEVKELIKNGFKEIVLTGINIGDFDGGKADGHEAATLAELIREVDQLPGLKRLRVSSIDPDEVDDDLTDAILNGKHTCKSMHIVLQSGSNVVLKRMNRKYTRQMFFATIAKLSSLDQNFTFTTDIIVGFPGETEVDFQDTLDAMKQVKFAKVHMFPYSDRPRTRSMLYPGKVSPQLIKERKNILMHQAEQDAFKLREAYVGRKMQILTESSNQNETTGHTDNFLEVIIPDHNILANQLIDVEIIANSAKGLIGKIIA